MPHTPLFTATPSDLLFFRDGRPIESGGGHGARWPEPSLIFDALHAALHRAFPSDDEMRLALRDKRHAWEHGHRLARSSNQNMDRPRTQRFGALATAGMFPILNGRWLFPRPADAVVEADKPDAQPVPLHPIRSASGRTNHAGEQTDWLHPVGAPVRVGKDEPPAWWSKAALETWLAGNAPAHADLFDARELYSGEWTTGIGIDSERQTQDGTRIYSAEYLRLKKEVALGFAATLPTKAQDAAEPIERIRELFNRDRAIVVGGQQRTCEIHAVNHGTTLATVLPAGREISGTLVRWVLISPAIFPRIAENPAKGIPAHQGGWLPNWIDPGTGEVRLIARSGTIRRVFDPERGRTVRRAENEQPILAKLVAARVSKLVPITGWSERLHLAAEDATLVSELNLRADHGPRSTLLAVPAGAVYYFETANEAEAQKLANALNWHGDPAAADFGTTIKNRRSTLLGEKGFGLGVCGTWQFHGESHA